MSTFLIAHWILEIIYTTCNLVNTKDLHQAQETLKRLCEFSNVWADRADFGTTETAKQKLKYATFEGDFFRFQGQTKVLNFF